MASLRVVQWATGNIGTRSLRTVLEHPDLELVGLYVHSAAKAGRDAGDLCGLPAAGVAATDDVEEIVALGADCVLYMPLFSNIDDVCRLLESGANVVSACTDFLRPASMDPAVRERVEAACEKGGTSLHSTGSSPGFVSEALPLVLTSLQRRLDLLAIDEFADLSQRDSPDLLFGVMGFGGPAGPFDERRLGYLTNSFGPSLQVVADAVGLPLDRLEASGEWAAAAKTTTIAAGTLEQGTTAASRITIAGIRGEKTLLRFRANWYCITDLVTPTGEDWDLRDNGWRVTVDGDAPLDVEIRFRFPVERMAEMTPGYTAHRAVNAVPVLCAAAPGIRTSAELPQILATSLAG